MDNYKIEMIEYPDAKDWMETKRRTLVTIGKEPVKDPTFEWKVKLLEAMHSPIRRLRFSFYMEIPYWVSVHLCRHVHAQPYIQTQRNDRQKAYDRNKAPQDSMVKMIWDMNAEELITVAHKRLCNQASLETRLVVQKICNLVIGKCPEFKTVLVPNCVYRNGKCTEFKPCGCVELMMEKYK